jgi:uncharacterized protein with HEPN domain
MSESSKTYYLKAIVADVRNIRAFVTGYDFETYAGDLKAQYAVERAILNISEAVRNLEKHGRRANPEFELSSISLDIEWAKIKGIGNIMRHDYENVTNGRIWAVITDHLDRLEQACLKALNAEP